tara:strand:- start:6741 stop:7160 length:420 start_codon:yes stop_codon:yes gene_type:complete
MMGLLKLLGPGALAAGAGAYGVDKATEAMTGGGIQFDPWGEKREAYERDLGSKYIEEEAYQRSKKKQEEAYERSKGDKDSFGYGTVKLRDSDWLDIEHKGEKYKLANIPEVQEVMQSATMFNMQDVFDNLLDQGYIKKA